MSLLSRQSSFSVSLACRVSANAFDPSSPHLWMTSILLNQALQQDVVVVFSQDEMQAHTMSAKRGNNRTSASRFYHKMQSTSMSCFDNSFACVWQHFEVTKILPRGSREEQGKTRNSKDKQGETKGIQRLWKPPDNFTA